MAYAYSFLLLKFGVSVAILNHTSIQSFSILWAEYVISYHGHTFWSLCYFYFPTPGSVLQLLMHLIMQVQEIKVFPLSSSNSLRFWADLVFWGLGMSARVSLCTLLGEKKLKENMKWVSPYVKIRTCIG